MYHLPIHYEQPVFRPPSEANSLLIQLTIGCSNNLCTYCEMYRSKKYRVRELDEILGDIDRLAIFYKEHNMSPRRVFLCDGDALGAPMDTLVPVLERLNHHFKDLDRVGIYATAQNMLDKTTEQLQQLARLKLNMAYLGMESGSDDVLKMVVKGNNKKQMIEGSMRLISSGWKLSVIAMLGLGGRALSKDHIIETADAITQIAPDYFSFLTTMSLKNTPYARMVDRGLIEMLTVKELLIEIREMISLITPEDKRIIFRANHVSNMYPLQGILPRDGDKIIQTLNKWIKQTPDGVYPPVPRQM